MAYATVAELESRLGRTVTGDEALRALAALDDASALVRSAAAPVDWPDPVDVPDIVKTVTLAAAARVMHNPRGVTQASTGDASVSYSGERTGGAAYLSQAERDQVRRAARHPNTYSVDLT